MRHCLYTGTGAPGTRRPKIRHDVKPIAMSHGEKFTSGCQENDAQPESIAVRHSAGLEISFYARSSLTCKPLQQSTHQPVQAGNKMYMLCVFVTTLCPSCAEMFSGSDLDCRARRDKIQNTNLCVSSIGLLGEGRTRAARYLSWSAQVGTKNAGSLDPSVGFVCPSGKNPTITPK